MRRHGIPLLGFVLSCVLFLSSFEAKATPLTHFQTFTNVNYASAGVGGVRETGYGTIQLTNVPAGTVLHAYLYWFGLGGEGDLGYEETLGNTNGTIFISSDLSSNLLANEISTNFSDGLPWSYSFLNDPSSTFHYIPSVTNAIITNYQVNGQCIGISGVDSWSFAPFDFQFSQAYRADVTSLVTGSGSYVLSYATPFGYNDGGLGNGAGMEGASLVVIYNDPNNTNKNDIIIENGCDENSANSYDALGWSATITNIIYNTGDAIDLEFHVGDGQLEYLETALYLNGQLLAPSNPVVSLTTGQLIGQVFWGACPYDPTSSFRYTFFTGSLWDINNYNIVPFLNPGVNNVTITTGYEDDDLTLVALVAKLKPGRAGTGNPIINNLPPVANPYVVATQEGVPVSVDVVASDSDPNSPPLPLAVSSFTQPATGGTVSLPGTVLFSPSANFTGTVTFNYTITNTSGLSASSTVTVIVTAGAPPLAPVANAITNTTAEGVPVTINVLADDSDPNSPALVPLSLLSFTQPTTGGTVSLSGTNLVFTPNAGFVGMVTFSYGIANSDGLTAYSTVTVFVVSPPVAKPYSVTTQLGVPVTINVLLADYDPNSPPLPIGVSGFAQPANGLAAETSILVGGTGSPTPVLEYTPNLLFSGTNIFNYVITNSAGLSATSTVTVIVVGLPLGPVANPVTATTAEGVPVAINVLPYDHDLNIPPLPIAVVTCSQPDNGVVTMSGQNIIFTPNPGFSGTVVFYYTIANSVGLDASSTVTVTILAPPVATPDTVSTPEGSPVTINVLANDTDPNTPPLHLGIASFSQPSASVGTVSQSGTNLLFTPAAGFFGTVTFQYGITNSAGGTASSTVTVVVLGPPAASPNYASTQEGAPVTINVLANDTDQNSPPLPLAISSFTQPTVPANGKVTLSGTNLVFTPSSTFVGTATFSYTITNTAGLASTATVSVLVVQVSIVLPAVQLTLTGPSNSPCDSPMTYIFAVTNTSQATETLTVVDPLLGGTIFSQANVSPGQGFVFSNNYTGASTSGTLTNTAWALGTLAGGTSASNTSSVTTVITTEGVTSQIYCNFNSQNPGNGSTWFNSHISANPGKPCTIYYQNASITLNCNNGKTYTYPVPNGKIVFSAAASTGSCAYNGTNWTTTLPCAGDSQIFLSGCAIPWQSAFAGCQSVCWSGTFSSDTAGISCAWQWGASCYGTNITNYNSLGIKSCHQTPCGYNDGCYAGTPENCTSYCQGGGCGWGGGNYTGSWSGAGNCSFTSCPLGPVANTVSTSTQEGEPIAVNVLAKDSDPNSPPLPLSIVTFTQPAGSAGTVVLSGGNLLFTPAAGFLGTATFNYTIKNSVGLTSSSTVTVVVTSLAPVATPSSVSTPEGVAITINVLGNDYDPNTPPLALTLASFSQPSGGVGTVVQTGTNLVFTPAAGFYGTVTFQYAIQNTAKLTSTSTVTVVVLPPPAVQLTVTAPATAPRSGTIIYTFAVTNTGQSSENLIVEDPLLGGAIFSQNGVAAGHGVIFTFKYTAGTNLVTLTNTAWAIGTVPSGGSATNTNSATTIITTSCVTNQVCGSFSSQYQNGGSVWCNAQLNCNPGKPCTVYCQNASVTFTCWNGKTYTYPVPNSQVTFTNCSSGNSSFDGTKWNTTLPCAGDNQIFLTGCGIPWQSDFANCQSVCWTGTFSCSTPGVNCNWQCGASYYNCNLSNCSSINVKACQQTSCGYNNSDYAGTPENCKSSWQGSNNGWSNNGWGNGGNGGNNYCGTFSNSGSFSCH